MTSTVVEIRELVLQVARAEWTLRHKVARVCGNPRVQGRDRANAVAGERAAVRAARQLLGEGVGYAHYKPLISYAEMIASSGVAVGGGLNVVIANLFGLEITKLSPQQRAAITRRRNAAARAAA